MFNPRYARLFDEVRIGPKTAPNRFYQTPHASGMGWRAPKASAALRGIKAEGGWGVVATEYCSIHPSSDDFPFGYLSLWDEGGEVSRSEGNGPLGLSGELAQFMAGVLAHALADRLRSGGADVRCGAEVTAVEVEGRRAVAVRAADGERYAARHAVIADVAAPHLYGRLLPRDVLPARTRSAMRSFEMDPGTVKVDWALGGPVPWRVPPVHDPGTFHVADSVEQMTEALQQVGAGAIPAAPFLLAGQMTTTDPTRSPAGTESMWAYTHVPQHTVRDAGDGTVRGVWDAADRERFADRMQARIEALAPGFGTRVLARRVLGPRELEARDANLIGGAVNGGTAQLHQQLVFRPVPGLGRAETPVRGLYLGSAAAHPGGGVHGAPGMNAARAALAHRRVRFLR